MTKPPLIVVMPLYNACQYVATAIRSILNQSYPDFQMLIIDDGSTDGSIDIVTSICDSRILTIQQSNLGVSACMNRAIEYADANGYPYIARMDSDDISLPDRFKDQMPLLTSNTRAAVCSSNCYYIDSNSEQTIGTSTVAINPKLIRWEIQHGLRGCIQGASIFRTACLKHIQGYRPIFKRAEEVDVFLRLSEQFEFINCPSFLYKIRIRTNSLSMQNIHENVLFNFYALDCFSRRKQNEVEQDYASFCSKLSLFKQFEILREETLLKYWRNSLSDKRKLNLLMASLLDPRRVIARLLRSITVTQSI
jgi:glycosyltransferase involved in cell wall biosynthesis